jgi:hypothetical protein
LFARAINGRITPADRFGASRRGRSICLQRRRTLSRRRRGIVQPGDVLRASQRSDLGIVLSQDSVQRMAGHYPR